MLKRHVLGIDHSIYSIIALIFYHNIVLIMKSQVWEQHESFRGRRAGVKRGGGLRDACFLFRFCRFANDTLLYRNSLAGQSFMIS